MSATGIGDGTAVDRIHALVSGDCECLYLLLKNSI